MQKRPTDDANQKPAPERPRLRRAENEFERSLARVVEESIAELKPRIEKALRETFADTK